MPVLTRQGRIKSTQMADSKASLLEALQDEEVVNRFQLIFEPIFKSLLEPISQKLNENLKSMCQSIATLQKEEQEKDVKIHDLENEVSDLKTIIDNHEQHGRRDSIRIFGLSEETSGTTDDKVMRLCNRRMKLDPPLTLDEISVSHRVGRIVEPTDDSPAPPRPLLVKFATRRSKNRVMAAKKALRPQRQQVEPGLHQQVDVDAAEQPQGTLTSDDEDGDYMANGIKIYLADDLTRTRAKLAFQARQERNKGKIMDTWVIDAKIMIKDNHSRITQITTIKELMAKVN